VAVFQIVYRVVLAGVWLVIGVGMLFRRDLVPANMLAGRDAVFVSLMGLLALALSAYNVLRLVAYLRRQQARARLAANPLSQPAGPPREREYIPELDFNKSGPPPDEVASGK
jgi:hypothetical protein